MGSALPYFAGGLARRAMACALVAVCVATVVLVPRHAPAQADAAQVRQLVQDIRRAFAQNDITQVEELVKKLRVIDPQHPNLPLYTQMMHFDLSAARKGGFAVPQPPTATPSPTPTITPSAVPTATPGAATAPPPAAQSDSEPDGPPDGPLPMFLFGALLAVVALFLIFRLVRRAKRSVASEPEAAVTSSPAPVQPESAQDAQPMSHMVPVPDTEDPLVDDYTPEPAPLAAAPLDESEPSFEVMEDDEGERGEEALLPEELNPEDEEPIPLFEEEPRAAGEGVLPLEPEEEAPAPEPIAFEDAETPLMTAAQAPEPVAPPSSPPPPEKRHVRPDERPPRQVLPIPDDAPEDPDPLDLYADIRQARTGSRGASGRDASAPFRASGAPASGKECFFRRVLRVPSIPTRIRTSISNGRRRPSATTRKPWCIGRQPRRR